MARIFSVLALIAVLLLIANFVVGLAGGDFNAAARQKREAANRLEAAVKRKQQDQHRPLKAEQQPRPGESQASAEIDEAKLAATVADEAFRGPRTAMTLHMLLGSAAALVTVLVNSITITYFIGTTRWCKEVCETYGIVPELAARSTRLKRSTFPWALSGILAMIVVVGLGAAADPSGANWQRSAAYVLAHFLAAILGLVVVMAAFWVQISRIAENYGVIEQILAEVQRIRAERHLPVEEPVGR